MYYSTYLYVSEVVITYEQWLCRSWVRRAMPWRTGISRCQVIVREASTTITLCPNDSRSPVAFLDNPGAIGLIYEEAWPSPSCTVPHTGRAPLTAALMTTTAEAWGRDGLSPVDSVSACGRGCAGRCQGSQRLFVCRILPNG